MTLVTRPAYLASGLEVVRARLESEPARRLAAVYGGSLEKAGGIPCLSSFDLAALGRVLSSMVLYEVGEDRVTFRLIGEECKRRFNGVRVGDNYLDFVQPIRREQAWRSFSSMLEHRCAMAVRNLQILSSGQQVFCEALGVPLRSAAGLEAPDRLLFADSIVREDIGWTDASVTISYSYPSERCFIDLGYGLPESHEDFQTTERRNIVDAPLIFEGLAPESGGGIDGRSECEQGRDQ
ncbi:hypothetical protein KAJ83_03175 [Marivibrio halodurans]|uniref:PAS domain-containing protein n=1 Tax=Marivibrio halodurans TaxID=2039722 RepID=A0A8J7RWV1_9PROT|nr:hypothetical protein [Marivibrio halodurans]MBP5855995.1 hypothetical protein [Marivibrio halodurans]